MAQAQKEPERAEATDVEKTIAFIRLLDPEKSISATHPTKVPGPSALTDNAVKMQELMDILREEPSEGDRKEIYDATVSIIGKEDAEQAMRALERMLIGTLQSLEERANTGKASSRGGFGDNAGKLETLLNKIQKGTVEDPDTYAVYEPYLGEVSTLLIVLKGGEAKLGTREVDKPKEKPPLPAIMEPLWGKSAVHIMSAGENEAKINIEGEVTPAMLSLLDNNQAFADNVIDSYKNAYKTLIESPNDATAVRNAAFALADALGNIDSNKEIWEHQNFKDGMAALRRGDLRTGLDLLSKENSLRSVYDSLSNFYVMTVNPRSIAVLSAGLNLIWQFDQNMQGFQEIISGARKGKLDPGFIYAGAMYQYQRILLSGQLRHFKASVEGGDFKVEEVKRISSEGEGDVHAVTALGSLAFTAWAQPVEVIFHGTFGHRKWEVGATVETDEGAERMTVGDKGGYVGILGAEARFPGIAGERWPVRVDTVGVGVLPQRKTEMAGVIAKKEDITVGPMAYVGISLVDTQAGNNVRYQFRATPMFSYFLEQFRVGGELRPLDFTIQASKDIAVFIRPGFRYEYTVEGKAAVEGESKTGGQHLLEGRASVGARFLPGFETEITGGVIGEVGGAKEERLPTSGFGGLNITLTPSEWFRRAEKKKLDKGTVPRKAGK